MDPIIRFDVTHAAVYYSRGEFGQGWRVEIRGRAPRFHGLCSQDRRDLPKEWTLTLRSDESLGDYRRPEGVVGTASYVPTCEDEEYGFDECFDAEANVPTVDLHALRDHVLAGGALTGVGLHIRGLAYGSAPDGSDKIWDIAAGHTLPITEVKLGFTKSTEEPEQVRSPVLLPDVPAQDPTARLIDQIAAEGRATRSLLNWVMAALVALVLIAAFG